MVIKNVQNAIKEGGCISFAGNLPSAECTSDETVAAKSGVTAAAQHMKIQYFVITRERNK